MWGSRWFLVVISLPPDFLGTSSGNERTSRLIYSLLVYPRVPMFVTGPVAPCAVGPTVPQGRSLARNPASFSHGHHGAGGTRDADKSFGV